MNESILIASGLMGAPIVWDANGNISGRDNLTPEQNAALDAAIAAYDPLPATKAARILEATAACDAVLAPFGLEYGVWETATWDQQYSEALAYTSSPTADVPLLAAMCVARGISIAELSGKIINNRAAWVALTGYVIGQRQRIVGLIEAAQTVAEVEAVDMAINLPG